MNIIQSITRICNRSMMVAFALAAALASCSDYLNQESQDEVIVHSVSDYSELLLGSGYPTPSGNGALYNVLYILDDDYQLNDVAMSDDEDYTDATGAFPIYTWQPNMWQDPNLNNTYYNDPYSATYERLMGVNAVLDGIDEASGSDIERDQVKAEALALRGYYYFMLVNLFGEPYNINPQADGVPLKLTANTEINGRPRNTVADVYTQIIKDLTGAATLFAKYDKRRGSYRINLPAVNILLTRVYLQMGEWQKVIDAATAAIKAGGSVSDYTSFTTNATISTYELSEVEWLFGNGYRPCSLPGMSASTDLMALYTANDKRAVRWFQGSNHNVFKHRLGSNRTPTNAIRTSEAYIARAEAYARLNMYDEAVEDYNHLASLRIQRYTRKTINGMGGTDKVLDEILNERRRELCYDEVRWFDLRRLGMPAIKHQYKTRQSASWLTYTLSECDPLYTLPIPNTAITQNTELTQNASATQPARTPSNN